MMIPYGKQTIDKEDVKAVINALSSEYLTTGPKIDEFEKKFARFVGSKYAVSVSSGTAALHLACLAGGLGKGDELITSPMTFAASANCALYCGAKPVFVDIKENGLIDESLIEKKITSKTRIIIPVHLGGLPCEMEKIKTIAKKNKLIVIEDACHALGSRYMKSRIGDCKYSDMTVFSFHPVKHITTGEGGMITTNSKELYEKLLLLRTHGITRDSARLINKKEGPWFYEMQELGFNYRITDFQCALGISQLGKIKKFIGKRIAIAKAYDKAFSKIDSIEIIKPPEVSTNAYHLYTIKVKDAETRLKLFNHLKENGILCQVHYIPVYWHPYYQKLGYKKGLCLKAEKFYERIISIPMYYGLILKEQKKVINIIGRFYAQ
jgi:perosamine synthetase